MKGNSPDGDKEQNDKYLVPLSFNLYIFSKDTCTVALTKAN